MVRTIRERGQTLHLPSLLSARGWVVPGPRVATRQERTSGLPYGEVKLNMTKRLALNIAQTVATNAESS